MTRGLFVACLLLGQAVSLTMPALAQGQKSIAYLNAIRDRDFPTYYSLSAGYARERAQIKASNPQVLWKKLEQEAQDKARSLFVSRLDAKTFTWKVFLSGGTLDLPFLHGLLSAGSVRQLETKQNHSLITTFVQFTATDVHTAPIHRDRLVKTAIISVLASGDGVEGAEMLDKGYEYFPDDEPSRVIVASRYATRKDFTAVTRLLPNPTSPDALALVREAKYSEALQKYLQYKFTDNLKHLADTIGQDSSLRTRFLNDVKEMFVLPSLDTFPDKVPRYFDQHMRELHSLAPADRILTGALIRALLWNAYRVVDGMYFEQELQVARHYSQGSEVSTRIISQLSLAREQSKNEVRDPDLLGQIASAIATTPLMDLVPSTSQYFTSTRDFLDYIELRQDGTLRYHTESSDRHDTEYKYEATTDALRLSTVVYRRRWDPDDKGEVVTSQVSFNGVSIVDPDGEAYALQE